MTENQKLREAFSRIRARLMLDVIDSHTISLVIADCDQALAMPTAEQVDDINVAESFTSVTKTAAPAQEPAPTWSLREALQKAKDALSLALSDVDWRKDSPTQPVIHKAYNCAHQALALPTAAPVGDLADLPRYTAWSHLKTHGGWPEGIDRSWMKDEMGRYNDVTVSNAVIAELRAALSAGDAVDAQRYRWLMDNCTLGIKQNGVGWSLNTTACIAPDCIKDVGAAIDAAMRKGQP